MAVSAAVTIKKVSAAEAAPPAVASAPAEAAAPDPARNLIDACLAELKRAPEPLRAARLHYEVARLYECPLYDVQAAAEHYQKAYAHNPEHLPALRGARRALLDQGKSLAALPLYDAEARLTAQPERRALVLYAKGRLLEDKLNQKREAREAYAAALELDVNNPTLLKAVERTARQVAAWEVLDKTYEHRANNVGGDPRLRAAIVAERARLIETKRADPRTAVELYQAAIELDARAPAAADALKRLHYDHQRWQDLIRVLERDAELAADPGLRAASLYRAARIQIDRLGQVDAATASLERATREAPSDRMILEELARLYERAKRYQDYVAALERVVALATTARERTGLRHHIGQIYEERLDDQLSAIAWYSRELEDDPTYQPATQALAKLYVKRQQWEPLIQMHLAEAESSLEPSRRAAAHARIADLYEVQLSKPVEAASHHARALGIVPGYAPSFRALVRLYSESGKFREVAELYERAIENTTDRESRVVYLFKLGRLQEDLLSAAGQAMASYQRILDLEPDNIAALHALQRAAERAARYRELIAALELEASKTKDRARILPLYHRAGEVSEQELDDSDGALAYYKKVIALDDSYLPALSSLGRLYYARGRWDDLLGVYRLELKVMPKGGAAARLLYKIGELCEYQLGNDKDAVASYREAVSYDPAHTPSLHALQRKLEELGQWQDLVKVLELELGTHTESALKARTAFRIGEVYENRLGQPEKALVLYEQALSSSPEFEPALDGRARLLAHARDWKRVVDELERKSAASMEPLVRVSALFRQAEVWRDEIGDPVKAVQCFEAVIEHDPAHIGALLGLEALYAERGAWEPLGRVLAAQARVSSDTGARVAALRELGRLQEAHDLGGADAARQTYSSILELSPADTMSLYELERLALAGHDHGLLAQVDAQLAQAGEAPAVTAAHRTRLAEALEASGDRAALGLYRAALQADPEELAAVRGLTRLAEASGEPGLLIEAAEREAEVMRDPARAADLFVKSAALKRTAGDSDEAVAALIQALEVSPDHREAADELTELLLPSGQVDRLLDLLGTAARTARTLDRKAALWGAAADLLADRKNDLPAALAALARVISEQPAHVPTLSKLSALYVRDRQWKEAVDLLHRILAQSPAPAIAIETHLRLAEILARQLGDAPRAMTSIEAVLRLQEDNREALKLLLAVQMEKHQTLPAAETAARLVRVSTDRTERAEALCHLARLEVARGEAPKAIEAYAQALPLVGLGAVAAEFKEVLNNQKLLGSSRWQSYVDALHKYLETGPAPALQAAVYLELGRVLDEQLRSPEKAMAALQRGLAAVPTDLELHAELAVRLKRAGHLPQAVEELRRLLELDVMRAAVWRDLIDTFKQLGRTEESTLAMAPLIAIGLANDLERSTLAMRPSRTAAVPPGAFETTAFKLVDAVGQPDAVGDLLSTLAEGLSKIHPPELDRYALSSRDRITSRTGHPLRVVADRVAEVFGIADFDMYLHRAHSGALEVEFTDPPAILVPAYVPNLSETQQVFLLSRVMANMARGLHPVDKYGPAALELLLATAARNVEPGFGSKLSDDEFLTSEARRVRGILSRRARRAMEEAAQVYVGMGKLDLTEWAMRVRLTATRAAAIVSDDLPGSVSLVRRLEADLSGAQGAPLAQGMRVVHDVLRFWVSDAAFTLRRRIGLI